MNGMHPSSRAFFEAQYRASPDPWRFACSPYELQRYQATLSALSQPSYERAFEPGCSVGVLTAALASRCRSVLACDIAQSAVSLARARCKEFSHVTIVQGDVAETIPRQAFDLIIFSELGYYFSAPVLHDVALRVAGHLEPGGEFIAVHWLGRSADHVLHGDQVHAVLADSLPFEPTTRRRYTGFRIDSWRRRGE